MTKISDEIDDEHRQALEDRDWWRTAGEKLNLELSGWTFRNEASFIDRETKSMVNLPGSVASRLQAAPQPAGVRVRGLDEAVERIGEVVYRRHERGWIMWPLVEGNRIKQDLHAILSAIEPQQEEAVSDGTDKLTPEQRIRLLTKFGSTSVYSQGYNDAIERACELLAAHPTPVQKVQESQTVSEETETVITPAGGKLVFSGNLSDPTMRKAIAAAKGASHVE